MTLILDDQNFEEEVKKAGKPVLVDFFAVWCEPCSVLGPILEKVAADLAGKIILAKVDVNQAPNVSQAFSVDRIPMVALIDKGRAISGFIGVRSEDEIKQWIASALTSSPESELIDWSDNYAKQSGFRLNPDHGAVQRVAKGLLANEQKYGKKYCPCRRISGNQEADAKNICPCQFHKDEIEKDGHCFCKLFVK